MNPYNSNGNIHQQDLQARNHARQEITRMLSIEAQRTEVMVNFLINKISDEREVLKPADAIWDDIQNSVQLRPVKAKADNNVADYPEFARLVAGRRGYIERVQKQRLQKLIEPIENQRRFANTLAFAR